MYNCSDIVMVKQCKLDLFDMRNLNFLISIIYDWTHATGASFILAVSQPPAI